MKGFIVYPTYRVKDGKAYVHLFGRLENGESFLAIKEYRPYFFIRQADTGKAEETAAGLDFDFEIMSSEIVNFAGERTSMVVLDNPRNVPEVRDLWHEKDIPTYEADIRFVYRFLIDRNIRGSLKITGSHEPGEKHGVRVDRVYVEPKLEPVSWSPRLKIASIDIESDKHTGDLFCISIYADGSESEYKRVFINRREGEYKDAECCPDEKAVLQRFREELLKLDPDVITGWNVIDFDFDFLEKKFKEHNVPFDLGRTKDRGRLRRYESYIRDSTADFPGRQVLDGMHLMRISFIRLEDGKLDTAAREYLEEGKLIGGHSKYEEIARAYRENPQKLIDYNLNDSRLVYEILDKSGIMELTIQRSLLTGMQLDRVKASVASLDNLYLAEARKRGIAAPTRGFSKRERRITGGFVMESKPGVYDYVIVCDFKSLYPSIMRTFNIDPWAYVPEEQEKGFGKDELIEAPNGAKFRREKGIIPELLQELWTRRNKAKKAGNKLESNAVKVLMNSIFGVLANPSCRFYSFDMANAITHFGQKFIKLTAEKIRAKGFDVIYGDTDSLFIDLAVEDEKEARKLGKEIQDYINNLFDEYITTKYKVESFLELEFEKVYKRFLMPKIRAGEAGAKKRYVGLLVEGGKEELDFVGLEFVRRDWTELSKRFQLGVLDKIFHKEDPSVFIREFVSDLKKGKYDDLLVYRKALRKDVKDYVKTTPPHVKAARKMEEISGGIIEYVMTVDGPEPADNPRHSIDYDHYIDKQLEPIANSVLTFYGTNFDDVLKGTKQSTLDGF